jgi:hypothetical protein
VRYREDILLPHVVPFLQAQHDPPAWQCHQPYCSFCAWFPARQECQCSAMASEEPRSQSHVWHLLDQRVRARAITPRNVWEFASALMEEWGSISQHIWCSPWGGDVLPYLMQLVATPETDSSFLILNSPPVQVHIIPFMLVTCRWNLFSLCLLNFVMFIQIFTHVKFAENKCSWQWEEVPFFEFRMAKIC